MLKRVSPVDRDTAKLNGDSVEQTAISYISFSWNGSVLSVRGTYDSANTIDIHSISMLGATSRPRSVTFNGRELRTEFDTKTSVVDVGCDIPLTGDADVIFGE